jgi:shikimate dehydrogenase
MRTFGLIGFPLSHSFSKGYFTDKFKKAGLSDVEYLNFEIEDITTGLPKALNEFPESLRGFNVTIPHKQNVMPLLKEIDAAAQAIGAVNVIKVLPNGSLKGYNSDYYGFKLSVEKLLSGDLDLKALVLGTGGASKAVIQALRDLDIPFQSVSRKGSDSVLSYDDLKADTIQNHRLLINTTPLGMHPKNNTKPNLPYQGIGDSHYLYDLVYNPSITAFMQEGIDRGAKTENGLDMLHLQAEKSWEIWNS